jgi:protein O-mannosyl-transferase
VTTIAAKLKSPDRSENRSAREILSGIVSRPDVRLAGVLFATLLFYLRSLFNGFVTDDWGMIFDNHYIGQWSFLTRSFVHDSWWFMNPLALPQSSYYRPLQDVWLAISFHLLGLNPVLWHAAMIALHLLVVWLVFKVASALTADTQTGLLAALLFGLLPVHVDAVAWASAIPFPLSAAFELAAFYFFMRRGDSRAPWRGWMATLLLYALALISHESAVIFPGIVAGYVFLLATKEHRASAPESASVRGRVTAAIACAAPFAVETALYLTARLLVLGFINRPYPYDHATVAQSVLTVPGALLSYLALLALPWRAGPAHELFLVDSWASPAFYVPLATLIALCAAFVFLIRRSERFSLYLFLAAWIAVAIAPVMNLRGLYPEALVQDRYLYLASVGWCVILADVAVRYARGPAPARWAAWVASVAVIVVCAGALWNVQRYWHDDLTILRRCIAMSPRAGVWHRTLGNLLERRGHNKSARRELELAYRLNPRDPLILFDLGGLHANIGLLGRPRNPDLIDEGIREMEESLARTPDAPAKQYVALATYYGFKGDRERREELLQRAEALPGGYKEVAMARAQKNLDDNDAAGAEVILRDLVTRYHDDYELWDKLGIALLHANNLTDALSAFKRAIALDPPDAVPYFSAGMILHQLGYDHEALAECRRALKLAPDYPAAEALIRQIQSTRRNFTS